MVRAHDANFKKAVFNSSFGSLSFLGLQGYDDESSVTGSSISGLASAELENEVELLYFPQDSMLVKAGEKNAGLYFVIEGFLDVSMPEDSLTSAVKKSSVPGPPGLAPPPTSTPHPRRTTAATPPLQRRSDYTSSPQRPTELPLPPLGTSARDLPTAPTTPLFTVKPGGIAGYLSSLSSFPSYVDIRAKTECYVGFLPVKALEKIMDRKPIVLLTLAKRLISLLSPLGESLTVTGGVPGV